MGFLFKLLNEPLDHTFLLYILVNFFGPLSLLRSSERSGNLIGLPEGDLIGKLEEDLHDHLKNRSKSPNMFFKKGVLRNFGLSLQLYLRRGSGTGLVLRTPFLQNTSGRLLLKIDYIDSFRVKRLRLQIQKNNGSLQRNK